MRTEAWASVGVLAALLLAGCSKPKPEPVSPPVTILDAGQSLCASVAVQEADELTRIARGSGITEGKAVDLCVAGCTPFAGSGADAAIAGCIQGARQGATLPDR